jgi:hypothetical protein
VILGLNPPCSPRRDDNKSDTNEGGVATAVFAETKGGTKPFVKEEARREPATPSQLMDCRPRHIRWHLRSPRDFRLSLPVPVHGPSLSSGAEGSPPSSELFGAEINHPPTPLIERTFRFGPGNV